VLSLGQVHFLREYRWLLRMLILVARVFQHVGLGICSRLHRPD